MSERRARIAVVIFCLAASASVVLQLMSKPPTFRHLWFSLYQSVGLSLFQNVADQYGIVLVQTVWLDPETLQETASNLMEVYAVTGFSHNNSRITLQLGSPIDAVSLTTFRGADYPRNGWRPAVHRQRFVYLMLSPNDGSRIVLLPEDKELIRLAGWTEAEYREFVRYCKSESRIRPGEPVAIGLDIILLQIGISLVLAAVAYALTLKAKNRTPIRQSADQQQPSRRPRHCLWNALRSQSRLRLTAKRGRAGQRCPSGLRPSARQSGALPTGASVSTPTCCGLRS